MGGGGRLFFCRVVFYPGLGVAVGSGWVGGWEEEEEKKEKDVPSSAAEVKGVGHKDEENREEESACLYR